VDLERPRDARVVTGRDPFAEGPLSESDLGSSKVREVYLALKSGLRTAVEADAAAADESILPDWVVLRRVRETGGLFDYQQDLSRQIVDIGTKRLGRKFALVALPTGAGKTRTAVYSLLGLLQNGLAQQVLWLAPTRELLDQAFEAFTSLWALEQAAPTTALFRCHALGSFPASSEPSIYFATPQMVLNRLRSGRELGNRFDVVVFDEAHHVVAPTFRETFLGAAGDNALCLGLSATPGRTREDETHDLVSLFQGQLITSRLLHPNALRVLESRGVLAKLRFELVHPEKRIIGQRLALRRRAHLASSSKHLQYDVHRFRAVVHATIRAAAQGRTLVFAGSIPHALALFVCLKDRGESVGIVSAGTPLRERERILDDFKEGRLRIVINKTVLATGYDCPAVSAVVLTSPIRSSILFEQIVGRASRGPAVGGAAESTVIQLDDHLALHGLPESYHRYENYEW
jgi:DNA repair protein RadD